MWFDLLKEDKIYYHATDYDNLMSIFEKGILPKFGEIYSTEDPDLAAKWICFTKIQSRKIIVIPYRADTSTHKPASDHSPMMLTLLGAPSDSKVFVTKETIPPEDIILNEIVQMPNPCFNEEFANQYKKERGEN
jgi:hypothetical protein